jgi:hypothetical protein
MFLKNRLNNLFNFVEFLIKFNCANINSFCIYIKTVFLLGLFKMTGIPGDLIPTHIFLLYGSAEPQLSVLTCRHTFPSYLSVLNQSSPTVPTDSTTAVGRHGEREDRLPR